MDASSIALSFFTSVLRTSTEFKIRSLSEWQFEIPLDRFKKFRSCLPISHRIDKARQTIIPRTKPIHQLENANNHKAKS